MESKLKAITDYVLGEISAGRLPKGAKAPSEYMLAEQFGVNKSTANKAMALLAEQGYLRRLKGKGGTVVEKASRFPLGRVAVVMRMANYSFYRKILDGAQMALFQRGYSLEMYMKPENMPEPQFWSLIQESGAVGALLVAMENASGLPRIPRVAIDYMPSEPEANYVVNDNFAGGCLMAGHLLARGHRELVFIATDALPHHQSRQDGFLDALAKSGVGELERRVFHCSAFSADGNVMIQEIRARFPKTSAIAFNSDIEASHAAIQLLAEGVKIPQEISIAGYGALAEFRTPGFTIDSVEQNPFRLGSVAADGLLDIVEGKRESCVEILPVKVVPGNTVATLRKA